MKGIINDIFTTPRNGTIRKTKQNVSININATKDSSIRLTVKNAAGNYYNFTTKSFTSGFKQFKYDFLITGLFSKKIEIPSVSSNDTYTFEVIAVKSDISSNISTNPKYFSTTVSQIVDTVLTFSLATDTSGDFSTFPSSVTSTNPYLTNVHKKVDIDWTLTAQASVAASALSIARQPLIGDFYVETGNYTANGGGSNSTSLILTSVSGLKTGMKLSSIAGTYQSDLREILSINSTTKTVTLSGNESWSDTNAIKFRAYGNELIESYSGALIESISLSASLEKITKIVNGTTSESTAVTLTDVTGIRADEESVVVTGPSIASSTSVYVDEINFSGKVLTLSSAQSFKDREVLTFDGTAQTANLALDLIILKQPTSATTIYFDVDNIITSSTT